MRRATGSATGSPPPAGRSGQNSTSRYESAQGNPAIAAQIARKLVGEAPDVIVPISTPSAQAVVGGDQDIPVVFTAVTDPLGAKLVSSLEAPGGNVTGMSDLSPIGLHMDLIKEIMPDAQRLGVIYNPGEANSVTLVELLKLEAPVRGLEVVEAAAPRSSDVLAAAQSLVGKVDAIYVPTDNTVVTALEAIVKVGIDNQLPVFAGDTDSVPRGAIAALGFNYYDLGRQTGQIVARVLDGEAPGAIAGRGRRDHRAAASTRRRPRRWASSCRRRCSRAPRCRRVAGRGHAAAAAGRAARAG